MNPTRGKDGSPMIPTSPEFGSDAFRIRRMISMQLGKPTMNLVRDADKSGRQLGTVGAFLQHRGNEMLDWPATLVKARNHRGDRLA